MWTSLFYNFSSKHASDKNKAIVRNSNLQSRIANLLESSEQADKESSPMLKELQKHKNKVKRMSSVYEENIAAFNESNASILMRKPLEKTPLSTKFIRPKAPEMKAIPLEMPNDKKKSYSLKELIEQLVESDLKYIKHMETLLTNFVETFDSLPALRLKNEAAVSNRMKQELFGSIESIYVFHKCSFHPKLLESGQDVKLLATNIAQLCSAGFFSNYIIHAMDQKNCEYRRNVYYKPFIVEIIDKCGFEYDFAPVKQLNDYHQILMQILQELRKNAPEDEVRAMELAEEEFESVLSKVNSMAALKSL